MIALLAPGPAEGPGRTRSCRCGRWPTGSPSCSAGRSPSTARRASCGCSRTCASTRARRRTTPRSRAELAGAGRRLRQRRVRRRAPRARLDRGRRAPAAGGGRACCWPPSSTPSTGSLDEPEHPFVVVIGGVKVADKIGVIDRFTRARRRHPDRRRDGLHVPGRARDRGRRVPARGRGRPGDGPPRAGRRRASAAASWCCRWTSSSPTGSPPTPTPARSPPTRSPTAGWASTSGRARPSCYAQPAGRGARRSSGTARWACSSWSRSPAARSAVAERSPTPAPSRWSAAATRSPRSTCAGVADRITPRLHRRRRRARAARGPHAAGRRRAGEGHRMSRTPFVAGNWKMHKTASEAGAVRARAGRPAARRASTSRSARRSPRWRRAVDAAAGTRAARCSRRTCTSAQQGAFTGEVSAPMLLDLGVDGVLLGHSERRQHFAETDAALAEQAGRRATPPAST